ncbi:MAG: DNA repair protein RadA [Syntrophomonadaceae bacterium]|nr:DNA repair protein RadA [Bacillota bacterium]
MKASSSQYSNQGHISTGLSSLDNLLGGGIALGKITEFAGSYSTGKSTLVLQMIASAQKHKHDTLYVDTEYSFTIPYAEKMGIDCSKMDIIQERLAENMLDSVEEWATNHKRSLIVLDSVGGILPREESEKSSESRSIGLQARIISSFCRKIIGILAENENALVITNHTFVSIDTGKLQSSGGAKLAYHRSYWITLRPVFGKTVSRATDGSKKVKPIEAELRKEKGMDTVEGKKCELILVAKSGFQNEAPVSKRGRPKST